MRAVASWWHDLTGADDGLLERDIPSWMVSLVVHMAVVVVLGTMWLAPTSDQMMLILSAVEVEEDEQPQPELQQFRFTRQEQADIGSPEIAGMEMAMSAAPLEDQLVRLPTQESHLPEIADLDAPTMFELATAPVLHKDVRIKGPAGEGAVGTLGALDRITQEILRSLEQRRTLVVWLFDRSGSMQAQREAIRARFDRIYEELGLSSVLHEATKRDDKPLLSSVIAFGQEVTFLTPDPTDDVQEIKNVVAGISNDPSGYESTFTAIGLAVQRYQSFRVQVPRRNVMVVVFTDEVGDDEAETDRVIAMCRRNEVPVYVVGVPAPFGRSEIEVKYVDPDPGYDQSVRWIPVRQGPESLMPETVQLTFSGRDTGLEDIYRIDSGFGPYCLTRLCYETGGIYFAVHANRDQVGTLVRTADTPVMSARLNFFFDPLVMRSYRPDYVPLAEYQRRLTENRAKYALVQAAQVSRVGPMDSPRLTFVLGNDENAEARMKQALDVAQRAAAVIEPRINALYEILRAGEPDRAKLSEPRWRAGYDLAMGRVLAVKVRTEAYNFMLAKVKNGYKFEDEKNNTLQLVPADEISVGSVLEKQARQARMYLERVVAEHPGTPWALLAETELKEPIGWKWTEGYTTPPPQRNANPAPNSGNRRPQPPPRPATPPRPVRQDVRL